jgi:ABC-type sugar transport system ATPase subunit
LAFVHQELNLVQPLSVAENLVLGAGYPHRRMGPVDWRRLYSKARRIMDQVDLDGVDPRQRVASLSPVQQRLVMIGSALWHEASVLILDEPTAALSGHEVDDLHRLVRRMSSSGTAILYVSHRLSEVLSLTDRVVVMRDGAVQAEARTREIDNSRLVELISGEAAEQTPGSRASVARSAIALRVDGITNKHIERPVSFSVHAGEVVGLAGLVGSGRSELLRAIYGADPRSAGTVTVDGKELPSGSPRAALRAGLVMLSEDRRGSGLVTGDSVARNISFARLTDLRRNRRVPMTSPSAERRLAHQMIDQLAIKTRDSRSPVMSLSGGNQQKVLLARWLATEPKVLLLDEPTLGVDVNAKSETYALIQSLANAGAAIVVASSEFAELELLCDRALVVVNGQVVAQADGDGMAESALLRACFAMSNA